MLSTERKAELFDKLMNYLEPCVRFDVAMLCHMTELAREHVEGLFLEDDEMLSAVRSFFNQVIDHEDYEYILRMWLPKLIRRELDAKEVSITWE